jgi:hypothetical protein
MSKPENPGECECCGYATTALSFFKGLDTTIAGGGKIRKSDFWYCDLCSSTPASTYSRYPSQEPSNADVLLALCHIGNVLLSKIPSR